MNGQRCGTCDWWGSLQTIQIGNTLRGCSNPMSVNFEMLTRNDEGTNCPCYQRKELDEHNSEGTD